MDTKLKNSLMAHGASLVGYADISALGFEQNLGFDYAISIALKLDPVITGNILNGPFDDYCLEYTASDNKLYELSVYTESLIGDLGFQSYALIKNQIGYDKIKRRAALPHKTAARLAGLGWIGKNALLITKEFGSAVRLTTILTDLPLHCGHPIEKPLCGSCTNCCDICPGKAIKNTLWSPQISRDNLVDIFACEDAVSKRGQDLTLKDVTCGLCIANCPYTQNYIKKCNSK